MNLDKMIQIGFDKNGEAEFLISATISDLSFERMKELRAIIPVAIGVAENMWRNSKHLKNPASQESK